MLALVILIVFGLGMAFFATQNTGLVHILIGNYMLSGIPLYVLVITAVLLGVFISWLISMVSSVSSLMTLRGKDVALHHAEKTIHDLEEKNQKLSLEIAQLKGDKQKKDEHNTNEASVSPRASFFEHMSHNFT